MPFFNLRFLVDFLSQLQQLCTTTFPRPLELSTHLHLQKSRKCQLTILRQIGSLLLSRNIVMNATTCSHSQEGFMFKGHSAKIVILCVFEQKFGLPVQQVDISLFRHHIFSHFLLSLNLFLYECNVPISPTMYIVVVIASVFPSTYSCCNKFLPRNLIPK
jgi:hypothetical protein